MKGYNTAEFSVTKVAHSVMTEDGESDIEVVLSINETKVALLIEDKIDAVAMPNQAGRYSKRREKAVERHDYGEYYIFIIAPQDYLNRNSEAHNYAYSISYEAIRNSLDNEYEIAVISRALKEAKNVKLPRNKTVTDFWDKLYDYLDKNYPGIFQVGGHRGLERSGTAAQWITM